MKRYLGIVSLLALVFLIVPSVHANLITNGEFNSLAGWDYYGAVNNSWSQAYFSEHNASPTGYIWQDFNTVVGQEYRLQFYYTDHGAAAYHGYTMGLGVYVGTSQPDPGWPNYYQPASVFNVLDSDSQYVWLRKEYDFTAVSTTTYLAFDDISTNSYQSDFHLDNVSVSAIPEPTTMLLLGTGLLGLAGVRRKFRK